VTNNTAPISSLRKHKSWVYLLAGAGLGLYLSRLLAEFTSQNPLSAHPLWFAPFLASLGVLAGWMGYRWNLKIAPAFGLYLYVLWPGVSTRWAFAAGCFSLIGMIIANGRTESMAKFRWSSDLVVFLTALVIYTATLAPSVLPADAGEFQLVTYVLGIAHPPGYPLYTMLGKLFTLLPLGDIAYRVNLFAAVSSALTLLVLHRTVREITSSAWAGATAALILGASTTFWAQSTTANIRSLTALFTSLCLLSLARYIRTREDRHLHWFALWFGLGITHHSSIVLLGLPFLLTILVTDPSLLRQPRRWLRPAGIFLASMFVLLYLPLRSRMGPAFDPSPIRTWQDFLEHVLALGFRGDILYFTSPRDLWMRSGILLEILRLQFGGAILAAFLLAAGWMTHKDRKFTLLCGGVFIINALAAITYRAPQTVEYLLPSYVALATLLGCGLGYLSSTNRQLAASALLVASLFTLGLNNFLSNYPSFTFLSRDWSTRQWAEEMLQNAPDNAVILSNWHQVTPLWYLQKCEGWRPDVSVRYVYPEGAAPMSEVYLRRIKENIQRRPVIVTNYYQEYQTTSYRFIPFFGAWQVETGALKIPREGISPLNVVFGGRIRLLGYRLEDTTLTPGDSLSLRVYWTPQAQLDRDYSFFVHLVGEEGIIGQGDITHPAANYRVGETLVNEYRLPVLPGTAPGDYRIITGVYITFPDGRWERLLTDEGSDSTPLGHIRLQANPTPPTTSHPLHVPFDNDVCLIGVDQDTSVAGARRVYLHWRCPANAACKAVVMGSEGSSSAADLPALPTPGYLTTVHDLPETSGKLRIELRSSHTETRIRCRGPWGLPWTDSVALPPARPKSRFVSLGGEMALIGVEITTPQPDRSVRVTPHFLSLRPLRHDYVVSVSIRAEDGHWQAQHDTVPALGAVPTLKWVSGWHVRDPHVLKLPEGASGPARVWLTVYDAFTLQPLPVLDDRLAKIGQGIQMEIGRVEIR